MKECKGVVHDKFFNVLPPRKNNQHQGTYIRYDFEDPFLCTEFVQDYIIHRFLDYNLKTSSFQERGTNVGERSQEFMPNSGLDPGSGRPGKPTDKDQK